MTQHSLDELVMMRVLEQPKVPLWEDGPSFTNLMDRLCLGCVDAAHLDAWLPMTSPTSHPIIAFFFQGAALHLADKLLVHRKIATSALLFAAINHVFPPTDINSTTQLILGLDEPRLDGEDKAFGFHLLGATAVDEWLKGGLIGDPPTKQFLFMIDLVNEYAKESTKDPHGLSEVVKKAIAPRKDGGARVRHDSRPGINRGS